jgi:hypothetical protein
VRQLRTVILLVLALLWAPLTVHCGIELASGWDLLSCHSTAASGVPGSAHCDDDCCLLETAHYQLPAAFHHDFQFESPILDVLPAVESSECPADFASVEPDFVDSPHWCCQYLAFVPIRGPSII